MRIAKRILRQEPDLGERIKDDSAWVHPFDFLQQSALQHELANLEAANMGNADSYVEKKDADEGKLPLPDWFTAIDFGSWNCTQVSERITGLGWVWRGAQAQPWPAGPEVQKCGKCLDAVPLVYNGHIGCQSHDQVVV